MDRAALLAQQQEILLQTLKQREDLSSFCSRDRRYLQRCIAAIPLCPEHLYNYLVNCLINLVRAPAPRSPRAQPPAPRPAPPPR